MSSRKSIFTKMINIVVDDLPKWTPTVRLGAKAMTQTQPNNVPVPFYQGAAAPKGEKFDQYDLLIQLAKSGIVPVWDHLLDNKGRVHGKRLEAVVIPEKYWPSLREWGMLDFLRHHQGIAVRRAESL